MMRVRTDPFYIPDQSAPAITVHVQRENKKPIGFTAWSSDDDKPKKRKKKRKK